METWVELGREGRVEMGGREVGIGIIYRADMPFISAVHPIWFFLSIQTSCNGSLDILE